MINQNALNDLFKPYELDFMEMEDMFKENGISDEFVIDTLMELECSKSIDESCVNSECGYNMINAHNDELYIKLANGDDFRCKNK